MPVRTFKKLPIRALDGFPQSFRLEFNGSSYRVFLYVNVHGEGLEEPDDRMYELPEPGAYMVMRVEREASGGSEVIFQRKLVVGLEYKAAELAFIFSSMRVAKKNLNGIGDFGSEVTGGIAARWG